MKMLTTALSLTLSAATAACTATETPSSPPETARRGTTTERCEGVERTAERDRLLYDSHPEPWPVLPLILLSDAKVIGSMKAGEEFTICRRVDRSTWNRRYAWLEIQRPTDFGDDETTQRTWITMTRTAANEWVGEP